MHLLVMLRSRLVVSSVNNFSRVFLLEFTHTPSNPIQFHLRERKDSYKQDPFGDIPSDSFPMLVNMTIKE